MFNLYRHLRLASVLMLILGLYLSNLSLLMFGLIVMAAGTVGAVDLAERRIELLEKITLLGKEKSNADTETPENH